MLTYRLMWYRIMPNIKRGWGIVTVVVASFVYF